MNQKETTNLADTGKSRLTLAEIRAEKQRLEQEEAEIIKAEATAREQQKQRDIAAALSSVESVLQPVKNVFDQADAELLIFEKLMSRFLRMCHPWAYEASRNDCAVGCPSRTRPRTAAAR